MREVDDTIVSGPSVEQLCTVAAQLATAHPEATPQELAGMAAALWAACRDQVAGKLQQATGRMAARQLRESLPQPRGFPVELEDFLRMLLPSVKRTADRIRRWRDFLRHQIQQRRGAGSPLPGIGDASVEQAMKESKRGFDEADFYRQADAFRAWMQDHQSRVSSQAAQARWAKAEKNHLARPSKPPK